MAKALKNEWRRARAAAARMPSAAAPESQAPPVIPRSEWRAMTLREKYAQVAIVADVDDDERAMVTAAEMSDTEMARLLMRLGKEKILKASARAAAYKKEN